MTYFHQIIRSLWSPFLVNVSWLNFKFTRDVKSWKGAVYLSDSLLTKAIPTPDYLKFKHVHVDCVYFSICWWTVSIYVKYMLSEDEVNWFCLGGNENRLCIWFEVLPYIFHLNWKPEFLKATSSQRKVCSYNTKAHAIEKYLSEIVVNAV